MNKVMKEFLNTAIYLLCVLGAVWLVITFVGQRTEVEGASMENTLHNGDNLIVDKLSYRFHDPERFDIIVFPFQYQANTYYIKTYHRITRRDGTDHGGWQHLHQRRETGGVLRKRSDSAGDDRAGRGTDRTRRGRVFCHGR